MSEAQRVSGRARQRGRVEVRSQVLPQAAGDGLLELQRLVGNQVVGQLIQRAVTHAADEVRQDRNLAATILSGGPNGITPPLVNGTEIPVPHGIAAATERALNKPSISVSREKLFSGNYRARVTAVPTNTIAGRAYIPRNPPWVVNDAEAPRVSMNGLGGGVAGPGIQDLGPGSVDALDRRDATRFTAHGDAGDPQFLGAIQQHELHHAADHWRAANLLLTPWDRALQDQITDGRRHEAPTKPEAIAKVYQDAMGTPATLAASLETLWVQFDADFHASQAGRRSELKRFSISADGSDVTGYYDY